MFAEELSLSSQESSGLMDSYDGYASGSFSFCDLPLSVNVCDWDPSKYVYENSPSDQDLFEFITTKTTFTDYDKDDIIFCGKLIPYNTPKSHNTISYIQKNSAKSNSKNKVGEANKDHNSALSILATTRVKSSRWWMLAFGMGRFQMGKMELSDIKARQTRRNNSMKKVIAASESHNVLGGVNQKSNSKKRGKGGLWGLLRLLGCKGLHQNTNNIVKS